MFPTLKTALKIIADIPIASSVALQTSTLSSPIGVGAKQHIRWWVPFSVGATGGFRYQIIVPAGGSYYLSGGILHNTGAGTTLVNVITASAVFANALANAGNHLLELEAIIENGATAGTVDLQVAQNTVDVLALTILKGGFMDVETYA